MHQNYLIQKAFEANQEQNSTNVIAVESGYEATQAQIASVHVEADDQSASYVDAFGCDGYESFSDPSGMLDPKKDDEDPEKKIKINDVSSRINRVVKKLSP